MVREDGKLGWVQQIGLAPAKVTADDNQEYGSGALLLAGTEMLARVMRAISDEKRAEALTVVDDLVMRGHDLRNFCRDLLAHLRDLLGAKVSGETTALLDSARGAFVHGMDVMLLTCAAISLVGVFAAAVLMPRRAAVESKPVETEESRDGAAVG